MTFIWFIVWLINSTPNVSIGEHWNNWGIALVICILLDIMEWKFKIL